MPRKRPVRPPMVKRKRKESAQSIGDFAERVGDGGAIVLRGLFIARFGGIGLVN